VTAAFVTFTTADLMITTFNVDLCIAGTFCGVFRRQALDRGAVLIGCNKIVTGQTYLLD